MKKVTAVIMSLFFLLPSVVVSAEEVPGGYSQTLERHVAYSDWVYENEDETSLGSDVFINPAYYEDPYEIKRLVVKTSDLNFSFLGVTPKSTEHIRDDIVAMQFNTAKETKEALKIIESSANVVFAEPDRVVRAGSAASETPPDFPYSMDGGQYFSWGVTATGLDIYLDRLRNLPDEETASRKKIGVAVLDSGIDITHPKFQQYINTNIFEENKREITDADGLAEERLAGGDAPTDSQIEDLLNLNDVTGHGSHVAGIIIDCAAPFVEVVPIKVLAEVDSGGMSGIPSASSGGSSSGGSSSGGSSTVDSQMSRASERGGVGFATVICSGIYVAADDDNIRVINLSVDSDNVWENMRLYEEAINYAVNIMNKVVVISVGNIGSGTLEDYSPSANENVISVASVNDKLEPAVHSKHGGHVDIAAPGEDILSVAIKDSQSQYRTMTGTSMAAPHVSAFAALLLYENPDMTPAEVEQEIISRAYTPEGWDTEEFGAGILQAAPVDYNVEKPFISGKDELMFAPDEPVYRIDIYQMVYRLHTNRRNYNGGETLSANLKSTLKGEASNTSSLDERLQVAANNSIQDSGENQVVASASDSGENTTGDIFFQSYAEDVTRADFVTILNGIYDFSVISDSGTAVSFTDLDGINSLDKEKTRQAIAFLAQKGIVEGYPDGTFKPNENVTRAEAVKAFSIIAERNVQVRLGADDFNDVDFSYWAYNNIMNAAVAK